MKSELTNNFKTVSEFYPNKVIVSILSAINKKGEKVDIDYTINNSFTDTFKDLAYDGFSSVELLIKGSCFFEDTAFFLISNLTKQ